MNALKVAQIQLTDLSEHGGFIIQNNWFGLVLIIATQDEDYIRSFISVGIEAKPETKIVFVFYPQCQH